MLNPILTVLVTNALMNYHLSNLDGANHWYHIMVRRESGTTKLYINGVERDSSTMDYTIDNAFKPNPWC
jgi:hypothetical protein